MKRKILAAVAVLLLLAFSYCLGKFNGTIAARSLHLQRDLVIQKEQIELDRSVFEKCKTQLNSMISGTYTLEIEFPGKKKEASALQIELVDGKLARASTEIQMEDIHHTGRIVSRVRHDMHEGPSAFFMGLVDGDEMWGKIYVAPGQGWREGEPPAYGAWRAYPGPTSW